MNLTGVQMGQWPAHEPTKAEPHGKIGPLTFSMSAHELNFRSTGRTHVGMVRSCNEDAFVELPELGLWAVSDGMGGLRAGDVASQIIVSSLRDLKPPAKNGSVEIDVRNALTRANKDLYARGSTLPDDSLMGATVAAFIADGQIFTCLWAGDSRLYRMRDGKMAQLTRDHRYVQELLDSGVLNEVEARQHPRRNVITRAVGVEKEVELASTEGTIAPGDLFMLSSDGVTAVCSDQELTEIFASETNIDAAADTIVARCLEGGAPDNLTLILIAVS